MGRAAFGLFGLFALGWLGTGCALGVPAGARTSAVVASYRSFGRPAAPRLLPPPPELNEAPEAAPSLPVDARRKMVTLARSLVGQRHVVIGGRRYREDCTGLVTGVLDGIGMNALSEARSGDNSVTALYRFAQRHGRIFDGGRPLPGDLVFFRETYDLNRDGHDNDGLTHVGIVENVDRQGTVTVIHRVSQGVVRYRMNLAHPDVRKDDRGRVLNDYLRTDLPGRRAVLTGQLFAAYATLLPATGAVAASR